MYLSADYKLCWAEEIKSARKERREKREWERQSSGEAIPVDPEPDDQPPATHYKQKTKRS